MIVKMMSLSERNSKSCRNSTTIQSWTKYDRPLIGGLCNIPLKKIASWAKNFLAVRDSSWKTVCGIDSKVPAFAYLISRALTLIHSYIRIPIPIHIHIRDCIHNRTGVLHKQYYEPMSTCTYL